MATSFVLLIVLQVLAFIAITKADGNPSSDVLITRVHAEFRFMALVAFVTSAAVIASFTVASRWRAVLIKERIALEADALRQATMPLPRQAPTSATMLQAI